MGEWIFFDCMDTLLHVGDVSEYWRSMAPVAVEAGLCGSEEAFNTAYRSHRPEWKRQAAAPPYVDVTLPERLRDVLASLGVSEASETDVIDRMTDAFFASYLAKTCPAPGVTEMLDAWQGRVSMGVVSNWIVRDFPRRLLAEFGLDRYFDFILDSASVGFRKPAEEIYVQAFKAAGLSRDQASEVIFVGDNPACDVATPISLGMRAIHYSPELEGHTGEKSLSGTLIRHWDEFRPG